MAALVPEQERLGGGAVARVFAARPVNVG